MICASHPKDDQWSHVFADIADISSSPNLRRVVLQNTMLLARTAWVGSAVVGGLASAAGDVFSNANEPADRAADAAADLWNNIQLFVEVLLPTISDQSFQMLNNALASAIEHTTMRVGLAGGDAATSQLRQLAYNWAVLSGLPSAVFALTSLFESAPTKVSFNYNAIPVLCSLSHRALTTRSQRISRRRPSGRLLRTEAVKTTTRCCRCSRARRQGRPSAPMRCWGSRSPPPSPGATRP